MNCEKMKIIEMIFVFMFLSVSFVSEKKKVSSTNKTFLIIIEAEEKNYTHALYNNIKYK